ncbi:MAG: pantoate--beta-alanine ligase [Planctomycetota bacterium]|jgi:pantoate--beta-alanine ligase
MTIGDEATMRIARSAADLAGCEGCALVPTMGALHEGHLALVRHARRSGVSPVVVTIFVNPTQFGPGEDLDRYPRSLEADLAACRAEDADVVFCPPVEVVYPPGGEIAPPALPRVALRPALEDAHRPGHFAGVCQVVARLFDLTRPAVAVFGEKDYQQLLVIRAMVAADPDRFGALRIAALATVREPDGLAMSSRNRYLAAEDRSRALGLVRALEAARTSWAQEADPDAAERVMRDTLAAARLDVDYAVVRDAETLEPLDDPTRPARGLVAARLGDVRLIDNRALQIQ